MGEQINITINKEKYEMFRFLECLGIIENYVECYSPSNTFRDTEYWVALSTKGL